MNASELAEFYEFRQQDNESSEELIGALEMLQGDQKSNINFSAVVEKLPEANSQSRFILDSRNFDETVILKTQQRFEFDLLQSQDSIAAKNGKWLSQKIAQAQGNEVILLQPNTVYKIPETEIRQPIRI